MLPVVNAPRALYDSVGRPPLPEFVDTPGAYCRICDFIADRSRPFRKWLPISATDWSLWHGPGGGEHDGVVCEPCAWVRAGKPGQSNVSRYEHHVWSDVAGWERYKKFDPDGARAALLRCLELREGLWFGAFCASGKKYAVPYAPINDARCDFATIAFDTSVARLTLSNGRWVALDLARILIVDLGARATDITTGHYSPIWLRKLGDRRREWIVVEREAKRYRRRAEWEVAVNLARATRQKPPDDEET